MKLSTLKRLKALRDCPAASENERAVADRLIEAHKPNRGHQARCQCEYCFTEKLPFTIKPDPSTAGHC